MNAPDRFQSLFDLARQLRDADGGDALSIPTGFLRDLSTAETREEVVSTYSVWFRQIVDADRCSIALDDGTGCLSVSAMTGNSGFVPGDRFTISDTAIGAVFTRQEPMFIPQPQTVDSRGVQKLHELGYRTIGLVPLKTRSQCFGVVVICYFSQLDQPGKVIEALEAIGNCLAMQLQLIAQMERLSTQVRTDPLTGAGNRYALYAAAGESWTAWSGPRQTPFSLIAADVDFFKQINDTYGHDIGDGVLAAFVRRLRSRVRSDDDVFRMGGEEFGILLGNTPIAQAIQLSQRLCNAIGDSPFAIGKLELTITASFGVTEVVAADQGFDDVLKRADMALYEAKRGGRDQVVAIEDAVLAA